MAIRYTSFSRLTPVPYRSETVRQKSLADLQTAQQGVEAGDLQLAAMRGDAGRQDQVRQILAGAKFGPDGSLDDATLNRVAAIDINHANKLRTEYNGALKVKSEIAHTAAQDTETKRSNMADEAARTAAGNLAGQRLAFDTEKAKTAALGQQNKTTQAYRALGRRPTYDAEGQIIGDEEIPAAELTESERLKLDAQRAGVGLTSAREELTRAQAAGVPDKIAQAQEKIRQYEEALGIRRDLGQQNIDLRRELGQRNVELREAAVDLKERQFAAQNAPVDTDTVGYWTRQIHDDAKNMALISGNKALANAVRNKLAANGENINQIDAQTRDASKFAKTALGHIADMRSEIKILDSAGKLGPIMSRWNDFWTGTVGTGPEFAELRNDLNLLDTAMGRVHGGARGGGSAIMLQHFKSMLSAKSMDGPTLNASLDSFEKWLKAYVEMTPSMNSGNGGSQKGLKEMSVDDLFKQLNR